MTEIVLGFPLWYEEVMEYAKLCGFKLYPYIDATDEKGGFDFNNAVRYNPQKPEECWGLMFSKHDLGDKVKTDEIYKEINFFKADEIDRTDINLLKMVKEKRIRTNLRVVEIPDDVEWSINEEEDGTEYVSEEHRTWG